jgi:hypothetical protein
MDLGSDGTVMEILRYRRLRERILQAQGNRIDYPKIGWSWIAAANQKYRPSLQWPQSNGGMTRKRHRKIDARLQRNGFDLATINAEVFLQAREAFAWFDTMLHAAQSRRIPLLHEIAVRREFDNRAGTARRHTSC